MLIIIHSLIEFLLGFSLFFPVLSLFVVGNTTGIQGSFVFWALLLIARLTTIAIKLELRIIVISLVWCLVLVASLLTGQYYQTNVNSAFLFSSYIILVLGLAVKTYILPNDGAYILYGFRWGAVFSSLYAIYQQIAFRYGLVLAIPFQNNPSFKHVAETEAATDRSYAFCPEPSVLAGLLLIHLSIFWNRSISDVGKQLGKVEVLETILIVFGLLATGSLSMITTLPLLFVFLLVVNGSGVSQIVRHISKMLLVGFGMISAVYLANYLNLFDFSYIVARLSNLSYDQSSVVRTGSKLAALRIFWDYPIFGSGVRPTAEYFLAAMPVEASIMETKTGTDSLTLLILSGQGIAGFLCFSLLVVLGHLKTKAKSDFNPMLLSTMFVMSLQIGYDQMYVIWVLIGVCLRFK